MEQIYTRKWRKELPTKDPQGLKPSLPPAEKEKKKKTQFMNCWSVSGAAVYAGGLAYQQLWTNGRQVGLPKKGSGVMKKCSRATSEYVRSDW